MASKINGTESLSPAMKELKLSILTCNTCGEFTEREVKKTGEVKLTPLVKIRAGATRLTDSSSSPVPGSGSESAKYLWIGEAPGENEDEGGEPFIGTSGKYLKQKLIPRLAGIPLAECRFTNIIKCHPEKNRDPYVNEIKACFPWLQAEIDLVKPEVIFAIGRIATKTLLGFTKLSDCHGQVYEWRGYPVMPLYHPAGVNRGVARKTLEDDFKLIKERLESNVISGSESNGDILRRPNEQYYNLVDSMDAFSSLLNKLEGKTRFSLDIETNESKWARERGTKTKSTPDPLSNTLAGIAISFEGEVGRVNDAGEIDTPIYSYYIPTCAYKSSEIHPGDFGVSSWEDQALVICALLQPYLRSAEVFVHNLKFEMESLEKYSLTFRRKFCTYLTAYALREENLDLKTIVKRRYSISMHNLEEFLNLKTQQIREAPLSLIFPYACADSEYCLRLGIDEKKEVEEQGLQAFTEMQHELLPWIVEEELAGLEIDEDRLGELDPYFKDKVEGIEQDIFDEAGYEFNMNSAQQKSELLFDVWGLPETSLTESGFPTTDKKELEKIAYADPIVEKFIEHGSLRTIQSTFIRGIPKLAHPITHRLHANVNQTVTETSRLSYAKPDWQNLPVRTDVVEVAKRVREAIIPDEVGWWIIAIDQSQIELRWAAHLSQDSFMLEIYRSNQSLHERTCQEIYQISKGDKGWDNQYKISKNGNFARLFEAGDWKLAETLHTTVEVAKEFRLGHEALMPGFSAWKKKQHKSARKLGYATTYLGFRRYLPNIHSSNKVMRSRDERLTVNVPIQGSSAQHIQLAMVRVHKAMKRSKLASRMIIQVHDELIFSAPEEEVIQVVSIAKGALEHAIELTIPTPVEVEIGMSWGELQGFEEWKEEQGIVAGA